MFGRRELTERSGPAERDLGEQTGAVLFFGGPYGNLQALRALLAESQRLGIPPRRMICTGDLAAYCADPAETVDLAREKGFPVLMGNCEESLAADAGDCGCGFQPDSQCETLARRWYAHAKAELGAEAKRWMGALPRRLRLNLGGLDLAVIHGGVEITNRFIFPSTPRAEKAAQLALLPGIGGIIAGHSGLPFSQRIGGRLWHNAGAIGLPANDGTPRGWFSVFSPGPDGIRIVHHGLDYDHRGAARAMAAKGLTDGYDQALSSGVWPSEDVLPLPERRGQGARLDFKPFTLRPQSC